MVLIKFKTEKDKIEGFYILATEGVVRGLPGNIFEINDNMLTLLEDKNINYTVIQEDIFNEADKIRNIPTPVV